ncbi:hypothetical protein PQ455_01895 [Sphingomonas naphthae]|uniref:Uncharacterized protein n=1 Tax=Sphingomonas naphthae TaxID=1813468 RepID=A0ABY7TL93_9SPHN|nr:hypothetical protein [Sphingomonas naphthae]WCT74011.1 hypothetical protein PQ455_01895 [Sphingomonas naphthae]
MRNTIAAFAVLASAISAPGFAQGQKIVDVIVPPQFVQPSCVKMMAGWEKYNSIEQPADIQSGVVNNSKSRMLVLTKNKAGQYWSVADLAPGESRNFRVNEGTNYAWAMFGGRHNCMKGFSLSNNSPNKFPN